MKVRYKHTNIVARDWKELAKFYEEVFGCVRVPPERHLEGTWLVRGTGVDGARIEGAQLRLPGYGDQGPTLEIFQYWSHKARLPITANREGIMHIAFEVEDVDKMVEKVLAHGGQKLGEITRARVEGVGSLVFVYVTDPEGNIIELQGWDEIKERS